MGGQNGLYALFWDFTPFFGVDFTPFDFTPLLASNQGEKKNRARRFCATSGYTFDTHV